MPDGVTHLKIWKKGIVPSIVLAGTAAVLVNPILGTGIIAGYLSGRYISPDLDLIGITSDEGRMMQELKVLGLLAVMIFFPYAYVMRFIGIGRKGHRNFFSHFPGVSTIIRIAWILTPPTIVWLYFGKEIEQWMLILVAGLWIGLSKADLWHYLADITHGRKRKNGSGIPKRKNKNISRNRQHRY